MGGGAQHTLDLVCRLGRFLLRCLNSKGADSGLSEDSRGWGWGPLGSNHAEDVSSRDVPHHSILRRAQLQLICNLVSRSDNLGCATLPSRELLKFA